MRSPRLIAFLAALLAMQSAGRGHQIHNYIQSTLVDISPEEIRLRINLTPGEDVAEKVIATIDLDKDGKISEEEETAYAAALARDLSVELDHRPCELTPAESYFPPIEEMKEGMGIVRLDFAVLSHPLGAGRHTVAVTNGHLPRISAYLINAGWPRFEAVKILRQKRNRNQSEGEIAFSIAGGKQSPENMGPVVAFAAITAAAIGAVSRGKARG